MLRGLGGQNGIQFVSVVSGHGDAIEWVTQSPCLATIIISLGVWLQTATIFQVAQRLRQSAQSTAQHEAELEALIAIFGRLQRGDGRSSTAERARTKSTLTAMRHRRVLAQRRLEQEAKRQHDEARNINEVPSQIQIVLAEIAALQRAIDQALRTFALETVAALTIVLLALQAELKKLISQPGIVST